MTESEPRYTFSKEERLYSQKRIDALFEKGGSFIAYPLRVVFLIRDEVENKNSPFISIMVSVSKRRFKRAVKRNRVKRLIRESYRLNKSQLVDKINNKYIDIAFLYLKDKLPEYAEIEKAMIKAFDNLEERILLKNESKNSDF